MGTKTTALAATLAFVCSAGVAGAQTLNPSPEGAAGPDQARALLEQLAARHNATANANAVQTGSMGTNAVSGWNYYHATNCGWYQDSGGNQWFYIFPSEGGIWYTINNLYVSQGLQISCSAGNYFGVYVTNTSTGAYNQTESYTYK